MSGLSLYQCERELAAALDAALDRETGEIFATVELEHVVGQFKNKATSVVAYIKNRQAVSDARKAHIAAVTAIDKAEDKKTASVITYISACMKNAAISRIDATDGTFSAVLHLDRDEAVEIVEGSPVDARFARIVPEKKEWDKTALKKAIKAGDPVPDCVSLVKRDRLEIK